MLLSMVFCENAASDSAAHEMENETMNEKRSYLADQMFIAVIQSWATAMPKSILLDWPMRQNERNLIGYH